MKRRKFFVLMMVCLLAFTFFGCGKSQEEKAVLQTQKSWEQSSSKAKMSTYCALIKEYMLLTEALGENTPYPAMNRSVKGNMISSGMTQEQALDNAEKIIIQEQAVFWYGQKAGISATEKQVEDYINENLLDQLKESDDYEVAQEACQKEGISFEDTIWAYKDSYKMQYILIKADVERDKQQDFVESLVKDYKESQDYEDLQPVLDTCRQLIEEGVTDQETIKNAEIYYQ